MMCRSRTLALASLLLFAGPALAQGPGRLTPLVVEGDRFFSLQWQAADGARPLVYGSLGNEFGLGAQKVRLLVDSLDGAGAVTGQTIVYVPGYVLPGSRYYFETRVPAAAASYRVQMFQWEWIQSGGGEPR